MIIIKKRMQRVCVTVVAQKSISYMLGCIICCNLTSLLPTFLVAGEYRYAAETL